MIFVIKNSHNILDKPVKYWLILFLLLVATSRCGEKIQIIFDNNYQ